MTGGVGEHLDARVVRLYVDDGLSTRRIAEIVGIDRQRVCRILRSEGIALAPRGAGRRRPLKVQNTISETQLRSLYVGRQMSSVEIGRVLGVSDRFLRSRMKLWGIETRSRGQWNRFDRSDVDPADLRPLYVEKEWSASITGSELGVSGNIVLRSAHTNGIPVRAGGSTRPPESYDILLIEALYDDPGIAEVLARHHIAIVREPGPIWSRFPKAIELTEPILRDLYLGCGVSSFHIELLTGAPAATIFRRLEEFGIERRGRGGRSPFMRRWQKKRRQSSAEAAWTTCE